MIDIPLAIRDDLVADSAITTLTGTRIWAERTEPEQGYKPTDGAAICVSVRGGVGNYMGVTLTASVQVKCYAETRTAANALYRAVYDRLHMKSSTDARPPILHSKMETLGQTLEEPDVNWIFVLGFFEIQIKG